MSNWRPIEKKQKDGTRLLTYDSHGVVVIARYIGGRNWLTDGELLMWPAPTHWQPLPEPPEEI